MMKASNNNIKCHHYYSSYESIDAILIVFYIHHYNVLLAYSSYVSFQIIKVDPATKKGQYMPRKSRNLLHFPRQLLVHGWNDKTQRTDLELGERLPLCECWRLPFLLEQLDRCL